MNILSAWTMLLSEPFCSLCLNFLLSEFSVNSEVEMSFISYAQRALNLPGAFQYLKYLSVTQVLHCEILGNH